MLKENISMLRGVNGYSQEEVAEKIGVSRQAYAKWEKGKGLPDVAIVEELAKALGTSITELLTGELKENEKLRCKTIVYDVKLCGRQGGIV